MSLGLDQKVRGVIDRLYVPRATTRERAIFHGISLGSLLGCAESASLRRELQLDIWRHSELLAAQTMHFLKSNSVDLSSGLADVLERCRQEGILPEEIISVTNGLYAEVKSWNIEIRTPDGESPENSFLENIIYGIAAYTAENLKNTLSFRLTTNASDYFFKHPEQFINDMALYNYLLGIPTKGYSQRANSQHLMARSISEEAIADVLSFNQYLDSEAAPEIEQVYAGCIALNIIHLVLPIKYPFLNLFRGVLLDDAKEEFIWLREKLMGSGFSIDLTEDIMAQLPDNLLERLQERLDNYRLFNGIDSLMTIEAFVKAYIQHKPTTHKGPVPLKQWFHSYDPETGGNLRSTVKGKMQNLSIPPGNKYYSRYQRLKKAGITSSFDDWILELLSKELQQELQQTPYFQQELQENLAIEEIVQAYIQHKPKTCQRPVSLKQWFHSYDPETGENLRSTVKGKRQNLGIPPGNKYCDRYRTLKKAGITSSFDDWILGQLSTELGERLLQTPYLIV